MGKSESAWSLTGVVGAGVMVIVLIGSVAGVMQIAKTARSSARPAAVTAAAAPAVVQLEEIDQVRRERDALLQEIRESRAQAAAERAATQYKDAKCVGGILFAKVNGELRNVGYCR